MKKNSNMNLSEIRNNQPQWVKEEKKQKHREGPIRKAKIQR